jgi:hypothetical protein
MGITYIEGTVTGPDGSQTLDFLELVPVTQTSASQDR